MQSSKRRIRFFIVLLSIALIAFSRNTIIESSRSIFKSVESLFSNGPVPLARAHAHNDYDHTRPLFDALDRGFASIEADIHLIDGTLYVAHDEEDIQPERTLQSLYLDPLRKRIRGNGGHVYSTDQQVTLLIDFKTEADSTYQALRTVLLEYKDILTKFDSDGRQDGPVIVIISGNRPFELLQQEKSRYAGIDGRLEDLGSEKSADFMPLISNNWEDVFSWTGEGSFPVAERQKLNNIVSTAHAHGQQVRFWATPDDSSSASEQIWKELLLARVDMINTDNLTGLQQFLLKHQADENQDIQLPKRGLCAHRGEMDLCPENTIPAFQQAIRAGAHMIEFDIQLTRDKEMVILHDKTLDRTTNGKGKVSDFTLAEIKQLDAGSWKSEEFRGERVPTLDEALTVFPKNVWLNIHLKGGEDMGRKVAEAVVKHNRIHQSFLACNQVAAKAAREVDTTIKICNMERQKSSWDYVNNTINMNAHFIQLLKPVNPEFPQYIEKLKNNNIHINYFGTTVFEEAKDLLNSGIEFPLVNNITLLMQRADELGIQPLEPQY